MLSLSGLLLPVRRVTYWLEDVNRGTLLLCAVFGNLNLSLLPDFEPRLRPIKADFVDDILQTCCFLSTETP